MSLRIERDTSENGTMPLDDEAVTRCPAFVQALEDAARDGHSTLFKRRDIACAEQAIAATFGEPWDHRMVATWRGNAYRFEPTIA